MHSATAAIASAPPEHAMAQVESRIQLADRDVTLLNIDLSDLVLPKVNDLNVDGLKRSWFSRLLGRR